MNEKENIEKKFQDYCFGNSNGIKRLCKRYKNMTCEYCENLWYKDKLTKERQAKKELVEALEDCLLNLEGKLKYAQNNQMRRWWNIENNLLRDVLNKHKEKE